MLKLKSEEDTEPLNSILIDFYLWEYAKNKQGDIQHIPIHNTTTIFY